MKVSEIQHWEVVPSKAGKLSAFCTLDELVMSSTVNADATFSSRC